MGHLDYSDETDLAYKISDMDFDLSEIVVIRGPRIQQLSMWASREIAKEVIKFLNKKS